MNTDTIRVGILLALALADIVILTCLSSRRGRISHSKLGRIFLWAASALYFPLISYILTFLTRALYSLSNLSCTHGNGGDATEEKLQRLTRLGWLVMLTVFVQTLKSEADMAALAVAAVASPAAGADDIDSQKIRPSMESLVQSFWVVGFVVYTVALYGRKEREIYHLFGFFFVIFPFWAVGTGRLVLKFAAFRKANGSFALGRNAQLIDGYMAQLQGDDRIEEAELVRHLIVTGEKEEDVQESLEGYRVKPSALEEESSRLVTLDKVFSSSGDHRLSPELQDLCLSFALFKCLRRRFAGYRLAEAGSTWALHFVCNGLLRQVDEERMFQVIAHELSFASDFYYSPLPVVSLGNWPAALHFILSLLICATLSIILCIQVPYFLVQELGPKKPNMPPHTDMFGYALLLIVPVGAFIEIWAMVNTLRSNWSKISMISHCINESRWSRMISSSLLRCKSPIHWKDVIGQRLLLEWPSPPQDHLFKFKQIFLSSRNSYKHVKATPDVKAAIIKSLRELRHPGRQLSNGVATVQDKCPHLTWACLGDNARSSTDAILVWHIATSLFEIKYPSDAAATPSKNMVVANSLSRYCAYLISEVPGLLPDNAARTKRRYQEVKKCVDTSMRAAASGPELYSQLVAFESVDDESSPEAKVVKQGLKLGKQLVQEAERPNEEDQAEKQQESAKRKEAMWELLAEFWSEMILYLAPSDNVKGHIEALQHGGELITLLWALLLHAGITTRPAPKVPAP